jgi:hypothetical protein
LKIGRSSWISLANRLDSTWKRWILATNQVNLGGKMGYFRWKSNIKTVKCCEKRQKYYILPYLKGNLGRNPLISCKNTTFLVQFRQK